MLANFQRFIGFAARDNNILDQVYRGLWGGLSHSCSCGPHTCTREPFVPPTSGKRSRNISTHTSRQLNRSFFESCWNNSLAVPCIVRIKTLEWLNELTLPRQRRFCAHHVTRGGLLAQRCLFKRLKGQRAAGPVTSHGPCGEDGGGIGAQLYRDLWI